MADPSNHSRSAWQEDVHHPRQCRDIPLVGVERDDKHHPEQQHVRHRGRQRRERPADPGQEEVRVRRRDNRVGVFRVGVFVRLAA